jgi:hypothetical protein
MIEKEVGTLIGYQPFGNSWFTVDFFVGPAYQWQTFQEIRVNSKVTNDTENRLWLRGGYNFSFRILRSGK